MGSKVKFQQVASIMEFVEQVQPEIDNILAFSMSPLTEKDVKLLRVGGLLKEITLFIPQTSDTKLLEKLRLRLDSR